MGKKASKAALALPDSARTPPIEQGTGFLLWRATNLWQRAMRQALEPLGLTHVQFMLLAGMAELRQNISAPSQAQLAAQCRTDVMMTSQVVRALETAGLLQRKDHPTDRRARYLLLTPLGEAKLAQAYPAVEQVDSAFFGVLGKKQGKLHKHLGALQEPVSEVRASGINPSIE